MNTRELHFSLDFYLSSLLRRANEHGSTSPFHGPWIGVDRGIADDFTLALHGEADVLLRQAANVAVVVCHLTDNDDKV